MMRSLWTAASGMNTQSQNINVIANNLANVNTTGFKKSRPDFQDLMYQTVQNPGSPATNANQIPTGIQFGMGARLAAVSKQFSPGDFQHTDGPLDLAIEGDGFFQIQLPDGNTAYTRAGAFKMDSNGRIVTPEGYPMLPEITIPSESTKITVGTDGTISVVQAGQNAPSTIGNIELANFNNPAGLSAMGKNFFRETDASGNPLTGTPGENSLGTIGQGFLEMSNVSVAEEMVNMIVGQRAYEANAKAITTSDEMLQLANNLKR
ncbi:MAG: flagellar basal-body rod protein FlgG [Trichlorobacter sp.]|nr:flagellar basal-body rod protein FlgG [Trichlorobacter sp.]